MANLVINGGTLTVESGTGLNSLLSVSNNGSNGVSNATVTQNAGTVTVGNIYINNNSTSADPGAGLYELNGGTLITNVILGQYNSGNYGTSTFDFNGGTLQASATNTGFVQGLTTVNVQAGGAIINTNGFSDTITSNLISDPSVVGGTDGGLTKQGSGTLTLSGTGNTYNGNTTVSGGTLQIDTGFLAATSTVSIASGATMNLDFTGTDTITALYLNGISQAAGVYSYANAPTYFGNFAGTLTVTGSNIPEPATLGLMALGGLGILASGRRRRA
jgi:autotransporter-associated beta strand protein